MTENGKEMTLNPEVQSLPAIREPSIVLAEAQKAAKSLQDVISKKNKPVRFNGEQYLEFEDWQTVGRFYGLAVATGDAIPVEIDGIKGAKAKAEVVDVKTGAVVGKAESYCLRDEANWKGKPWFQLASMAQTRAGAKALRNILSWVVVLAGYRGTPAEEMDGVFQPTHAPEPARGKSSEEKPYSDLYTKIDSIVTATTKEGKRWHKITDTEGISYLTDSEELMQKAQAAKAAHTLVKVASHYSKAGKVMLDNLTLAIETGAENV